MISHLHISCLGKDKQTVTHLHFRQLREDAGFQFYRSKDIGMGEKHFGPPQEKVSRIIEGEMKTGEDMALNLCIEIHKGVAAREKVEARDRGILNKIMTAKDDGAAEVIAKDESV